jgi:hypothetical protein
MTGETNRTITAPSGEITPDVTWLTSFAVSKGYDSVSSLAVSFLQLDAKTVSNKIIAKDLKRLEESFIKKFSKNRAGEGMANLSKLGFSS